ncbi:MAG: cell division protein SepF [Lachnospiraceae bacterium]|nr:cell division protein SepF [Lachnospiraceae bacterium]MBR1524233.1 cell division protein SepF [Lachnospiraceae bacterium]
MGVLDRFLNSMKFSDEDYEDDYMDDEDEVVELRNRRRSRETVSYDDEEETVRPQRSAKITQMPKRRNASFSNAMGVCVVKPTSVEDGQVIIDTLLDNRTVVVNLEGITTDTAQRIMDITFGANVALDGHLQQISRNIFIVTPRSVAISGDLQDAIGGGQVDLFGIAK